MEGDERSVKMQSDTIDDLAVKNSGIIAGPHYGLNAYNVTFLIGYMRDLFVRYGIIGDSTETTVSWSKLREVINAVETMWKENVDKSKDPALICNEIGYRISQVYPDGVCLYVYYALAYDVPRIRRIRSLLMKTIADAVGALSHHHGIGKRGRDEYLESLALVELRVLQATKLALDPKNIFANGNLYLQTLKQTNEKLVSKL